MVSRQCIENGKPASERQFSTLGLVQSKLRNRLGYEKAAKLTFMFRNMQPKEEKSNLNWIWDESDPELINVSD